MCQIESQPVYFCFSSLLVCQGKQRKRTKVLGPLPPLREDPGTISIMTAIVMYAEKNKQLNSGPKILRCVFSFLGTNCFETSSPEGRTRINSFVECSTCSGRKWTYWYRPQTLSGVFVIVLS